MSPRSLLPSLGLLALLCTGAPGGRDRNPDAPPGQLVGITVPSQAATVSPEQAGKIVRVPVTEGDRVEAGDVLFELNSTLEQLEVDRLQALADSDLFERRAKATLAHAEKQFERVRDLCSKDISSERDLQIQEHELELARFKVEQATLDKRQAENQLAQAKERLAQRTIKSPFAGRVTARFKSSGDAVEKFVPVVEVMNLDPLWVEFECPFSEAHLFAKGGTALVSPAMQPDDVREATILYVSPKANASSHSFMIRASVANTKPYWKTGMKMTIEAVGDGTPSRPGK